MKTLNRILTLLLVFWLASVASYAQRSGNGSRGESARSHSVQSSRGGGEALRRGGTTTRSHENVAPRHQAPSHNHSNVSAPRPGHASVAPHHGHHYTPVRPQPAHHVHGHPHYVSHIDRSAHAFYVDNCRYYHHAGQFYRYYPGHGYGLVSIPLYSYFPVLPFPCRRVVVGHDIYWEGDGTWFYETGGRYVLVEAPSVPVYEAPIPPAPVVVPARPHVSVQLSF
ncbi:MAG: hypothetical protein MJZ28_00600 [Paludibacteraceae bacterium]|nr:hypothetical protein [Paludibacteraceae bacterium]